MDKLSFTIPGRPISKKNSQRIFKRADGRPFIMPSKEYKEWEQKALWYLRPVPSEAVNEPVNVKCVYFMPTRQRCDMVNLLEATLDALVSAGILADDNCKIVAGHDGSRVFYDKENPRTEIEITEAGRDGL